jgi:RNA polymerase sigma-70 factor, ECF subfamily
VLSLNPTFVEMELPETQSLLARAQRGDAEAFCEICRAHETRLLRQAMALCGNESLAEELAQDTLVEAWKCLRRYNGRCQFFTWLCAILLNRFRNELRKRHPAPFSALAGTDKMEAQSQSEQPTAEDSTPDRAAEIREQAALMRKCIEKLSAKHQQVIYLRFYVGDSLDGIAAACGCSTGTVKSRLFHALERLRVMDALNGQFENPQSMKKNL